MTNMSTDEGVVLLPVPLAHVHEIAAYAAHLAAGGPSRSEAGDPAERPHVGDWTEDMVHALAQLIPYKGVLHLFDRCAEQPAAWVTKAQVEAETGLDPIQLRNELGAFSKTVKRHFGAIDWPIEVRKVTGKYSYRLDPQVAAWWITGRQDAAS